MSDLYIDDDYVIDAGKACAQCGKDLESDFDAFLKILSDIGSDAIVGGAVHDAVVDYQSVASSLKGQLSSISTEAGKACTSFINQIDSDDQWLY